MARAGHALSRILGRCAGLRRDGVAGAAPDRAALRRQDRERDARRAARAFDRRRVYPPARDLETQIGGETFEAAFRKLLHDGLLPASALPPTQPMLAAASVGAAVQALAAAPAGGELELALRPDPSVLDGRFANNGWLQELPKPITKLTWDNAILLSPRTAEKLGVRGNDVASSLLRTAGSSPGRSGCCPARPTASPPSISATAGPAPAG